MMKETKGSLKVYFIVVGVLGALSNIGAIGYSDIIIKVLGIINFALSVMFVYYGIKIYNYLQSSPKTLINFVIISTSFQAILRLLSGQIIFIILYILLAWYLIHNIKKLSSTDKK